MNDCIKETFAGRFKEALKAKNISAAQLSRLTDTPESVISQYKQGLYEPKQRRLDKFSKVLNVSVDWLMGYDVPMKSSEQSIFDTPNILPLPETKIVPLLGNIACGTPTLATENIDEYIKMSGSIKADFALKCKGDSMINARIFDGDIVYIQQQADIENGQIAAVLIGEEATLKRIYKYPDRLILRAENPLVQDIVISGEELETVRIIGKAMAFISMVR